jgi:hypothetical protein
LLQLLERSWWNGEFGPKEAERRLGSLKWLYKHQQEVITFLIPGHAVPEAIVELPDGGAIVSLHHRVPLPNDDPSSWTLKNCADAFAVIEVGFSSLKITEAVFTAWIRARGFERPKFWAEGTPPIIAAKASPGSTKKRRGRKPTVRTAVAIQMQEDIDDGTTTIEKLAGEKEESLERAYGCSRDTARKARDLVLSKFQFATITTNDK